MRDIPIFTTSHGVASLILKEIPYKGEAYIRIQDTKQPEMLLCECCDFCRAVGAERVYATGHSCLEVYPLHTAIWHMRRDREGLSKTDAELVPVQEENLAQWRTLYNEKMNSVPNSSFMTVKDADKLFAEGNCYFVRRRDALLGLGVAVGDVIAGIVSLIPGAGMDVLLALCSALTGTSVCVEVASVNGRATWLYEKLGFQKIAEIARWYQIFPCHGKILDKK